MIKGVEREQFKRGVARKRKRAAKKFRKRQQRLANNGRRGK